MQGLLMRLGGGGGGNGSDGSDRGQSSRAGCGGGRSTLRKGPWTAEEDEILVEYVRKNGPRNWSSILSQGLLLRDSKSCRFRWVNKLMPGLKTGCKFSAEEERVVIELQAQLGNKWARIATYLPGRTDNNVKNFWSTRQKRLARILRDLHQAEATRQDSAHSQPLPPPPQDQYASASQILMQDSSTDHLRQFDSVDDDLWNRFMNFSSSPPLPLLTTPSQPSLDYHHLPQQLPDLPPDLALFQFQELTPEELDFFDQQPPPPPPTKSSSQGI